MRLRVRLTLLGPDVGGRRRGVATGYRCQWRSAGKPEWNDAAVELDRRIEPGESCDAWLLVGVPQRWADSVAVGDVLEGGEGPRVVATAQVLDMQVD